MLLVTQGLTKRFGGLTALRDVDLEVQNGQVFVIIGPNGSGKTTFFNMVSGVIPPSGGRIWLDGEEITGLPSYRLAGRGISRTFQTIRLFKSLSVVENVIAARSPRSRTGLWDAFWQTPAYRREDVHNRAVTREVLDLCGLWAERDRKATQLPYGKQRRLEIARALATEPKLLLLDEPAAGLNPSEIDDLMALIERIRHRNIAVLMIEHQMRLAMQVAHRMAVFESGTKIAEGSPAEIRANPRVIEAYLGTEED